MKKTFIIILSIACFSIGIAATAYIFIKRETSDEAIKNRLLGVMKEFGEVEVEHAHMDILDGIVINNLSFVGTSGDVQGKSLKISKIVLKHNPQSLLKGQIKISRAVIIAPELTVEKPSDIWSLLDIIKENFDKQEMPLYKDDLQDGIEIKGLKIHIMEDTQTNSPEIKLSGVDITFLPYAGSFENIIVRGDIDDEFLGSYTFTMKLQPRIPRLAIEARSKSIELNEKYLDRFPYLGKMLWDEYKPVGKVGVSCTASFDNRDKQKKMDYVVNVNLKGLEVMYKEWPFLIGDLNGNVEINTEKVYLKDIVGYSKEGSGTSQVRFNGEFDLYGAKKTFVITIPNLFINEELLNKIPEMGGQVYSKIRPNGFVDMVFQYTKEEGAEGSCFLTLNCKEMEISPPAFPIPISHVNGQFRLCNNIIVLKDASGFIRCGDQQIFTEINGVYDMKTDRKIFNLTIPNLFISEPLLKNLPVNDLGEKLWTNLNPRGKIDITANFQGFKEEKDNKYSIEVLLKDCEMSNDKYKFYLWGIDGRLEIDKEGVFSKHIDAKCCGGHIEGALSVRTQTDPYRYEGEITLSRIILEEMAKKLSEVDKQWSGILYGRLKFLGTGSDKKKFYAEGQLNINEGYLSDVPIVLSVFNLLNLSLPKKESFHSALAKFVIKDGFIHVDEGRIYSDSTELNGRGDISLDGDINLTVVAGFNKDFFSRLPIVGRVFDFIVGGVRKQLTMVEIKGTFLEPESHSVPFKPFTRSIRNMFELLPKREHNTTPNTKSIEVTHE